MKRMYFKLQSKIILKTLPIFALGILIFSLLTGLAGFGIYKALYSKTDTGIFNTAIVIPEEDSLLNLAFDMISDISGLEEYINFQRVDEDTAVDMVKKNETYGAIIIPEGFIDDIIDGTNTPAKVIVSDNAGFESLLLKSVVTSGASTLGYVQAGIYALDDAYREFGASGSERNAVNENINAVCIKYALNRSGVFDGTVCSTTGTLSYIQFYVCAGILLVLFFSGMTLSKYICNESDTLLLSIGRKGINSFYVYMTKLIGITFVSFLILLFICIVGSAVTSSMNYDNAVFNMKLINIAKLLLVVFSATSFIMFVFTLSGKGAYGILALFALTLIMCFSSGIILPKAYLPVGFTIIGGYLPTGYMADVMHSLYTKEKVFGAGMFLLLYDFIFAALSILVMKLRLRK